MAPTPEELDEQRARIAELRQQIADEEASAAEATRDNAAEVQAAELKAEELRLQAELAEAKARNEAVKSNSSALEAAKQAMAQAQARLDQAQAAPVEQSNEDVGPRSTQDEVFADPDSAPPEYNSAVDSGVAEPLVDVSAVANDEVNSSSEPVVVDTTGDKVDTSVPPVPEVPETPTAPETAKAKNGKNGGSTSTEGSGN